MSVAVMRIVGLALAVTLTVSCDVQLSPDPPSSKSKSGSTSTKKPKPKPNPNPPPGVKHDIPTVNAWYDARPDWEAGVRSNCKKAGYGKDCLVLKYDFKKREAGTLTSISDPTTSFSNKGYKKCTVTKVTPPTSNSKKIPPKTKITVFVVCIPKVQSPSPTPNN
jgi:hypothetical protein